MGRSANGRIIGCLGQVHSVLAVKRGYRYVHSDGLGATTRSCRHRDASHYSLARKLNALKRLDGVTLGVELRAYRISSAPPPVRHGLQGANRRARKSIFETVVLIISPFRRQVLAATNDSTTRVGESHESVAHSRACRSVDSSSKFGIWKFTWMLLKYSFAIRTLRDGSIEEVVGFGH